MPLLFRLASSMDALEFLASMTVLATAAAPPDNAPKALRPANIGISGKTPPVFGIGKIRGVLICFLPPAFFTATRAAFTLIATSFFRLLFVFFFNNFATLLMTALRMPTFLRMPIPNLRLTFIVLVIAQAAAFSPNLASEALTRSQALCLNA